MAKNRRLSGWHLVDDGNWKERLTEIRDGRPEMAVPMAPKPHENTLTPPITECDPDCAICRGNAFYIDSQDIAIECPNARRKKDGV